MSEQDNTPKEPKKIGSITLNKKNIIKALVTVGVVGSCALGINSYISYKHQVFLADHATAISDIENKNSQGYKKAFLLLKDLVDDNDATSEDYFYLGYMYQYGLGTNTDYSDAYKYYKKATSDSNPQAYYQIATLYRDGNGVNKSSKKAIDYFKKSYDLGNKQAIVTLAELIESNNRLMSIVDSEILYEIYLAYKSDQIKEADPTVKNKYLATAAAQGYEPAIIVQARNFTKDGDNYRALMLWQTLLYSSDPQVSELAKKEIVNVEKLVKQQRLAEIEKEKKAQKEEEERQKQIALEKVNREKQIDYKRNVGLSLPKQDIKTLTGLTYINLFNVGEVELQDFYKEIMNVEIDTDFLKSYSNSELSYADDLIRLSKYKHNKSSLKFDFAKDTNINKYEGIVYYYYNDTSKFTHDILNSIMDNINPKKSVFEPKIHSITSVDPQTQVEEIEKESEADQEQTQQQPQKQDQIELTHQEKIQRMQVFAQKGDFRQFYKLEQAAKNGDVYAMYYVGEYYYNTKEYKTALKYFNKAANEGYGPAYYKLATLYYNEEKNGVPYNKEKAMYYYKKAADLGVRNAKHILMLID
ncbi:hypothetical protein LO80_00330 [Candidatus Francisella endociliophora]|uniref:Sel1 repeat family protein n=1 Tax=Candidatus Francisella endociliophora TaxID=653937 RepID=A0A097ELZ9_9GAMM|nr:tetratricopeptide repeat protein [Francisella sp. FSC1006]AIT08568.1 hypothetical protein LO80_00330 [Francisella sp. FSC1006]